MPLEKMELTSELHQRPSPGAVSAELNYVDAADNKPLRYSTVLPFKLTV